MATEFMHGSQSVFSPAGRGGAKRRMRGAKPLIQELAEPPLIASHALGTSPRGGEGEDTEAPVPLSAAMHYVMDDQRKRS
ncbi:hypothetical protein ASE23_21205 [Rhizobium sp. Root73]|nr:hypothetical protein ASD36_27265 [Rhizobium sp. Root1334]KRC12488.1 hypothetical protein ASE23_21205 [Rhizobium sp. Root73]